MPEVRKPAGRGYAWDRLDVAAVARAFEGRGGGGMIHIASVVCGGSIACCPSRRESTASPWAKARRSCSPPTAWHAMPGSARAGCYSNTKG